MKSRNTTSKEVSMQEELLAHLTTAIQHLNVPPVSYIYYQLEYMLRIF